MTFDEFSKANKLRCETGFRKQISAWSPSEWACALAGEVGEACNEIKKDHRGDGFGHLRAAAMELADVVTYADLLAQRLGYPLEECIRLKFNEVSDRIGSDIKL